MIIAAGLTAFMAAFSLFALSPDATSDSDELGENTALLKKGEKKKDMTMLHLLKSKDTEISTGRESSPGSTVTGIADDQSESSLSLKSSVSSLVSHQVSTPMTRRQQLG